VKFSTESDAISFSQTTMKIDGIEYTVKTVGYGDSVERSDVEGNSQIVLRTTRGMYKVDDGSLDMYADDFADLMEKLKATFYEVSFTLTNAYQVVGDSKLTIDTLVGCRFTKRSASDSAGADALTRNLGFKPRYIKWNGYNPFSNMPAGAE